MIFLIVEVCATAMYVVGSEEYFMSPGDTFTVPISIKNNLGIMGFKINVKYPDKQIKLKDISSGSITKNGLFNTSVTDFYSVKGTFDVVWTHTQDITGDGTLFILTFEALGYSDYGEYKIELDYSVDDTFNERWESVALNCQPILINITDEKTASKKNNKNDAVSLPENTGNPVSDDYLISSVKAVLDSYLLMDITDVKDDSQKESILKFVNSRNLAFSPDAIQYRSFEELKQAYLTAITNEAISDVIESVDGDKIIDVSGAILDKYGVDSFSQLSEKDKQQAVNEAIASIGEQGGDTQKFAYVTDEDVLAETFDKLVGEAESQQENAIEVKKPGVKLWMIITGVSALVLVVLVVVIVLIKNRKRKRGYENV